MKIAIFTDSFLPGIGGTEKAVLGLATALSKENEVVVCCPEWTFPHDDDYPFKVFRAASLTITHNDMLALPSISLGFRKKIKDFAPDIIHCHSVSSMAGYALNYGEKYNIPVVMTVHTKFKTAFEKSIKNKAIVNRLIKGIAKKLNKASAVATVSRDMTGELKSYGYEGEVAVVRNGAMFEKVQNLDELCEKRQKFLHIRQNDNVFLFVGRIEKYKNIEFILNALKVIKDKNVSFKMFFVGEGADKNYFINKTNELGLAEEVKFIGQVSDPKQLSMYYAAADLFIFPSIFDNDPLTVVESAVHCVPSITLEGTGSSERIKNGISGFISKNFLEEFANNIVKAISDKDKLHQIGKMAQKLIPKTWDQTANEYLEIYKKLIK